MLVLLANLRPIWEYTVDDAYISFRYARNLVRGFGLVYNPGEYVEGFSNPLWTLWCALGLRFGAPVELWAKLTGTAAAIATVLLSTAIARRLFPGRRVLATPWLLSASIALHAGAIAGLETALYSALVVGAALAILREEEHTRPSWPSGLLLGLALTTRPEAPLLIALASVALGRAALTQRHLVRITIAVAIGGAWLAFRLAYYGALTPNTFVAKVTASRASLIAAADYLGSWATSMLPATIGAVAGIAIAAHRRSRGFAIIAAFAISAITFVFVAGGDWMAAWRLVVPAEPFLFVFTDVALITISARGRLRPLLAGVVVVLAIAHAAHLRRQQTELALGWKAHWDDVHVRGARWFTTRRAGSIALEDIGYVGWLNDVPIRDIAGLVERDIARTRHAPTEGRTLARKILDEWRPRFVVIPSRPNDCYSPIFSKFEPLIRDPRFRAVYAQAVALEKNQYLWCVFELTTGK